MTGDDIYRELCRLIDRAPCRATLLVLPEPDLAGLFMVVLQETQTLRSKSILLIGESRADSREFADSMNRFIRQRQSEKSA